MSLAIWVAPTPVDRQDGKDVEGPAERAEQAAGVDKPKAWNIRMASIDRL